MNVAIIPFGLLITAFLSLLPYASRELLSGDLKRHGVIYLLSGACAVLAASGLDWQIQLLCAALALGTLIDRNIAFAPDGLVIPILLICALQSPLIYDVPLLITLAVCASILVVADLLWRLQLWFNMPFITSADILALVCPFLIFGLSVPYLLFNPAVALMIILARRLPALAALISKPEAVEDAIRDTGMKADKAGITFLAVAYPVLLVLVLWEKHSLITP